VALSETRNFQRFFAQYAVQIEYCAALRCAAKWQRRIELPNAYAAQARGGAYARRSNRVRIRPRCRVHGAAPVRESIGATEMTSQGMRVLRRLVAAAAMLVLAACQQTAQNSDSDASAADDGGESQYQEARQLDEAGQDGAAVELYRKAAEAGHPGAAYELGEAYRAGEGVKRDLAQAAEWFGRSADRGSARGQYLAGKVYADGRGVPQDRAKAVRYFARAATQGHAPAQFELGRAFANGVGVPQDALWAGRWYGKAARQGNAQAQFAYGAMLAAGERVPRDLPLGYAYLQLASEQGVAGAEQLLPAVETRMTVGQRERAGRHLAELRADGDTGFADEPTVRYVQAALRQLGFDAGPVDGVMGPRTRRGIRGFQRAKGMPVDGELSPALLERILDATRAAV
jgi:TPR repeat protein